MKYLLIVILFIVACEPKEHVPDYVWEEERFVEVLTEFQLTEAIVRLGYHRNQDSIILNDTLYAASFRKMGVNKAAFDLNYDYYLKDPARMEKIYQEVIENLSERSAELSKSKE